MTFCSLGNHASLCLRILTFISAVIPLILRMCWQLTFQFPSCWFGTAVLSLPPFLKPRLLNHLDFFWEVGRGCGYPGVDLGLVVQHLCGGDFFILFKQKKKCLFICVVGAFHLIPLNKLRVLVSSSSCFRVCHDAASCFSVWFAVAVRLVVCFTFHEAAPLGLLQCLTEGCLNVCPKAASMFLP